MKKKILVACTVLVATFFLGAFVPAQASAYLHGWAAVDKAETNTWNVWCGGQWYNCQYPRGYVLRRLDSWTVDVHIDVYDYRRHKWCSSYRRVYGHDWDSRVLEGQSGYWWCS